MRHRYRVKAVKRGSLEVIQGVAYWDGLASLLSVETDAGGLRYVSTLDEVSLTPMDEEAN